MDTSKSFPIYNIQSTYKIMLQSLHSWQYMGAKWMLSYGQSYPRNGLLYPCPAGKMVKRP